MSDAFCDEFPVQDALAVQAREHSARWGVRAVSPAAASLLTVLAAISGARQVVEVGTGSGVSTLALLEGLPAGATLTTMDIDSTREHLAKEAIKAGGFDLTHRVRAITGDASGILRRLSENSYDLAFVDADAENFAHYVYECLALLKPGGLLIAHDALNSGLVASPATRDTITQNHREVLTALREIDDIFISLVHAGEGLLLVYKK
nr:O-methyltransferase [Rothia sp. ZJ1223]